MEKGLAQSPFFHEHRISVALAGRGTFSSRRQLIEQPRRNARARPTEETSK